jgi:DNA invertase Pin-like site-specific DNA recombinase
MTAPRVALYARSAAGNDTDVARQIEDGRFVAITHGWSVVGEYVDQAAGGLGAPGAAWADVQRQVESGSVDIVWVLSVDRVSRSLTRLLSIVAEFETAGVEIMSGRSLAH